MAGEMIGESGAGGSRAVLGLGFAAGIYIAYDCMSTLNSSPWTHQTFGGDPGKAESAQHYVRQAIASSTALAGFTSWLMGSDAPLAGATVANVQLFYVYWRAGQKAKGDTPTSDVGMGSVFQRVTKKVD
jgi:hypothetical protein